jgi:AcrR family transcriptional regulator
MPGPIAVPTNARSRRTRAALLDAARALLEENGPAALTMAATAERAGVSRRSVYLHFATRADLLVALFDHVSEVEGLGDSLHPVLAESDPVAALDEFAAHLGRIRPRVRAVATAIQRQRRSDPDFAAHWEVVFDATLGRDLLAGTQLWLGTSDKKVPGGAPGARTLNPRIKSPLLYH